MRDDSRKEKTLRIMNKMGAQLPQNPLPEDGEEQEPQAPEEPTPEAGMPSDKKAFSKDALNWLKSTFGGIKKPAKGTAGKQVEDIDSMEEEQSNQEF